MGDNKRPTQEEVMAWLIDNQPALAAAAEVDRHWIWLPVDLRGDENKPVREAIKEIGFRWAKHGHQLPSGNVGIWGHSCQRPMPFKRRGDGKWERKRRVDGDQIEVSDGELLAMLG